MGCGIGTCPLSWQRHWCNRDNCPRQCTRCRVFQMVGTAFNGSSLGHMPVHGTLPGGNSYMGQHRRRRLDDRLQLGYRHSTQQRRRSGHQQWRHRRDRHRPVCRHQRCHHRHICWQRVIDGSRQPEQQHHHCGFRRHRHTDR